MVDPESVDSRLERLSEPLAELERIRAGGRAAYDAAFRDRLAAQHAIQLAIQICVDIGAHLIAELRLRRTTRRCGTPSDTSTTYVNLPRLWEKSRGLPEGDCYIAATARRR